MNHLGFIFQVLVLVSIVIVLLQLKYMDAMDRIRRNEGWVFCLRRAFIFGKLIALCWAVIYAHNMGWQPWPPFIAFLVAFDAKVIMEILVLRGDARKLGGLEVA